MKRRKPSSETLLQKLEKIGYEDSSLNPATFLEALEVGPKSVLFTRIVAWLTDRIASFSKSEEKVHATKNPEDSSSFLLELSMFLKQFGWENKLLTSGNVNQRLASKLERTLLLKYLIAELQTYKLLELDESLEEWKSERPVHESDTAKALKNMLITLRIPKPSENITSEQVFKKVETKLEKLIDDVPTEFVGKPLFVGELSPDQWKNLDKLQEDLNVEYKTRREMLLKRLDVTTQSFQWSDRIKPKEDQLQAVYYEKRNLMSNQPNVTIPQLLAARDDVAIIEKTSNSKLRQNTRSSVNDVIIGEVPDRGGRPQDQEPPPPEMPSWQKDRVPDRGGRGGRGGGGGGGRGQDNYNQNREPRQQTQYAMQGGWDEYIDRPGKYSGRGRGRGGGRGGRVQGGWNNRGRGQRF